MAKDFPSGDGYAGGSTAFNSGSSMAYPENIIKIVPTVPASQSERPQLRPVLPAERD